MCLIKMKNVQPFLFIIIILITTLSSSIPNSNFNYTALPEISDFTAEDLNRIALEIVSRLLKDAIQNQDQIKWPRLIDLPPDAWNDEWNQDYYGYYWGTAGIADTLLKFYSTYNNHSYLEYAEKAANFILKGAIINSDGSISWRTAVRESNNYYGLKYGNAGIAKFLLHLFEQTQNNSYSENLEKTLKFLEIQVFNESQTTHWSFQPNNTIGVTDIIYGTAGIASVFLEAGLSLNNTNWVNLAITSGKWLENISIDEVGTEFPTMAVPWSIPSFSSNDFYTGLGSGNAGVGLFFLDLYRGTRDIRWLENAKMIGNWLLQEKINDSWINSGVSYTTELDPNDTITGIDAGAAGIGHFFLDLYNESLELRYANGAMDAARWLLSNAIRTESGIKWPKATSGIDNDVFLTSYSYGASGIGDWFGYVYMMFGCPKLKETMLNAAFWLNSLRNQSNRIPVATGDTHLTNNLNQYGHHLSYYDGAAGIALFFLNSATRYNGTIRFPNVVSCDQLSSQTKPSENFLIEEVLLSFVGLLAVSFFVVITIILSKKKNNKNV